MHEITKGLLPGVYAAIPNAASEKAYAPRSGAYSKMASNTGHQQQYRGGRRGYGENGRKGKRS